MTGGNPEKLKKRVVVKDKFIGSNPDTGIKYFRRVKQKVRRAEDPSNVPTVEEVPPIDPKTNRPAVLQDHFMNVADRAEENDKKG